MNLPQSFQKLYQLLKRNAMAILKWLALFVLAANVITATVLTNLSLPAAGVFNTTYLQIPAYWLSAAFVFLVTGLVLNLYQKGKTPEQQVKHALSYVPAFTLLILTCINFTVFSEQVALTIAVPSVILLTVALLIAGIWRSDQHTSHKWLHFSAAITTGLCMLSPCL